MIAAVTRRSEIADSIAGYARLDGKYLDKAVGESGGKVVEVDDYTIIKALRMLFDEGILCEPASAASLATVIKLREETNTRIEPPVVLAITGSLARFPKMMEKVFQRMYEQNP